MVRSESVNVTCIYTIKFKMLSDWNQRQNERRQRIYKVFFYGLTLDSTSGSRPSHCRGLYITP